MPFVLGCGALPKATSLASRNCLWRSLKRLGLLPGIVMGRKVRGFGGRGS